MVKKKSKTGILKPLFSVLFLVLIAGGVFLYLNFGDIAKNLSEKIASEALGVKVRISSFDISLKDKKVMVHGIRISNPSGYKNAHAMTVQTVTIGLKSISKELIDFKQIRVEGVVVNLEVTEKGNNLTDLKNRAAAKSRNKSTGKAKKAKKDKDQVRVIVRKMVIGASTLNPTVLFLGGSLGKVKIPAVSLSGIGVRQNGVVAKDAITQIITKYISVAESKAGSAGLLGEARAIEKRVNEVGNELKQLGKNLGGIFGK